MASGLRPDVLEKEVAKVLKELDGLYDVADATDLEVVANVFGRVDLETQESMPGS